jgi:hypothetical protein
MVPPLRLHRLTLAVVLLGALCGLGLLWRPAGRLAGRRALAPADALRDENEREQRLERALQATLARLEHKRRVLRAVIERRLTFLEGAAHFRELRRAHRASFPSAPLLHQHLPEEEASCRQMIDDVPWLLAAEPEKVPPIAARLQAELKRLPRPVRLPPAPPL